MADVNRGTLITGALVALALGAGIAWWTRDQDTQSIDAAGTTPSPFVGVDANDEKPVSLYKWRGDDGVWHYTDQAPADRDFEVIRDTPNVTPVPTVVPEVPSSNRPESTDTIPPPPQ